MQHQPRLAVLGFLTRIGVTFTNSAAFINAKKDNLSKFNREQVTRARAPTIGLISRRSKSRHHPVSLSVALLLPLPTSYHSCLSC